MDPLSGLRVWITRPGSASETSAERWRRQGADVLVRPLLRLEALELDPDRRRELLDLEFDLVVLSSANAARHLVRALGGRDPQGRPWPVAAVGPATARQAEALGLDLAFVSSRATASDLADELLDDDPPRRVLLPGSDRQRPTLARRLEAGGVEVVELTLFRTRGVDELGEDVCVRLREGTLDLLVAYSPSAVDAWHALRPPATELSLAAIGETTAARVRELGLPLIAVPAAPGEDALLDAVGRWWDGMRDA